VCRLRVFSVEQHKHSNTSAKKDRIEYRKKEEKIKKGGEASEEAPGTKRIQASNSKNKN
jgi:hypothetical protein